MSATGTRFSFLPVAECVEIKREGENSLLARVEGLPTWDVRKFSVVGFKVDLVQSVSLGESLSLTVWPSSLSKGSFIRHG